MAGTKSTATPDAPEYPTFWDWVKDGKTVDGLFRRAGTGYTQMGPRPFVVLEVGDEERTVWLHHEVLRNFFAREVHRRPNKAIAVGERIRIWQLEPRESQSNAGRAYTDYRVEFPDGPELSMADIFGALPEGPQPEGDAAVAMGGGPDDGIPFQ